MNGQEAVDMVTKYLNQKKHFDLILMDLIMPVMDGYKSSREIRKVEKQLGSKVKQYICGCSAQVNRHVEDKCHEVGMDDIIAKPLQKDKLASMLKKLR